jgi:glycosyltransferase involved in cell wall biosynthesis
MTIRSTNLGREELESGDRRALESHKGIAIVMPAYNAEFTLEATLKELPRNFATHVILIDDCSSDNTVAKARELGITVIEHAKNRGYGGNQKTCYTAALDTDADIVIMLHPDNQYDARVAPVMASLIQLGICDVVLGNRIRTRSEALHGGMPLWKYIINRFSTFSENMMLGQNLGDFHSGFRAYSREVLERIPFNENSEDFTFDQEFLIQAISFGFKIGDIPVPVRYFDEASSISFKRSVRYGMGGVSAFTAMKFHKLKLRRDKRFT